MLDPRALESLYAGDHLTITATAARLGCSPSTILRRLRRFAIPTRSRGPYTPPPFSSEEVWSPEVAYAVGLIATDGCLRGTDAT